MKKIILLLAMVLGLLIGCSHTAYIREHPDLLKPGLHASAFLEVWGQPDETMSYLDYQNKQYQYSSGGSWNDSGGGYYSHGSTYTPQMIVWVYRKYGKVLFFSRNRLYSPLSIDAIPIYSAYELVGWRNFTPKPVAQMSTTDTDWKFIIRSAEGDYYVKVKDISTLENTVKGSSKN